MIVLGFDTATRSTTVGLRLADGGTLTVRDDPAPEERPGHATRLLSMTDELLTRAGVAWSALDRIAVGLGPGRFTGLRVGIATARGLAQSLSLELVGVSSLMALAHGAAPAADAGSKDPRPAVLAVIDALRGEAFAGAYRARDGGSVGELLPPRAVAPEELGDVVAQAEQREDEHGEGWLAVGDGAIRFRGHLELAGVTVPADVSPLHLVDARAICDLGACAPAAASYEEIVPDYRRRADAEIALQGAAAAGSVKP
jgi:tRNA threonylcarbamoyladenosine biosynthesis protein TsaB